MYGFRFLDEVGRMVSEVGLPVAWNHAEFRKALPVTFFGVKLELPRPAARLPAFAEAVIQLNSTGPWSRTYVKPFRALPA